MGQFATMEIYVDFHKDKFGLYLERRKNEIIQIIYLDIRTLCVHIKTHLSSLLLEDN